MTNEEASKVLETAISVMALKPNVFEAMLKASIALEKQIPRKPIPTELDYVGKCPNCGASYGGCTENFHMEYCCKCGQALDWIEYDGKRS